MKKIASILAIALGFSLHAEPVTLNRSESFELHAALSALAPGLTPDNTLAAADDINALDYDAKAYRLAAGRLLQAQAAANAKEATPEQRSAFLAQDASFGARAEERKVYQLTIFVITKDEVKAANISAMQVATIKRLLRPDAPTQQAAPK